jgi:hypothetical protein
MLESTEAPISKQVIEPDSATIRYLDSFNKQISSLRTFMRSLENTASLNRSLIQVILQHQIESKDHKT